MAASSKMADKSPPVLKCFLCCCCCSSSDDNWPKKTEEGERNSHPEERKQEVVNDNSDSLTMDEMKSWMESFDNLMHSTHGRKYFREFLRSEYSEENMLFWLACEELAHETNCDLIEDKARRIYQDYISILSPKEVSLDSRVREKINRSMVRPNGSTFAEAQLQVYMLMHRDSYPRFLNSQLYKQLLQQQATPP